jgi:WD40 repeat protein
MGWNSAPEGESSLKVFDVATLSPVQSFSGIERAVVGLAFSPDGKMVAASQPGPADGARVVLCDVASGRTLRVLEHHANVRCLAFAPDGKTLAVGMIDGNLALWDPDTGARRVLLDAQNSPIFGLAYAPDGRTLVTMGRTGGLKLWEVPGPRL